MTMTTQTLDQVDYNDKAPDYFSNRRGDIIDLIPPGVDRLLDVGCAGGVFGTHLMEQRPGIEVWGIEPMETAAKHAAKTLSRVLHGSIESSISQLPDGHFDCICFNDVLEHLTDPWAVLRSVSTKLSPNGAIVASIPNLRYYPVIRSLILDRDFRYASHGVLDSTHLRFFTRKSMQRLFVDCGYVVNQITGLSWYRFPFVLNVINRLSGRAFEDMHYLQFAIESKRSAGSRT